ncbi:MAG: hypothetical protein KC486_07510 [Myxococcales bacterium]|nr:hypothetical protein [Myxococcales bacterium]
MAIPQTLTYALERYLVRGTRYHLLAVAAAIGLIAVSGGVILWLFDGGGLGESIWWAFLRLTDPGYLGDDEGLLRRTVSTAVTVLGYVLFMGSLVAILTQWLNATMRRLESGITPIHRRNHLLLLGWTPRTASVVKDLLSSQGRLRRFLALRRLRRLHLVILAPSVDLALVEGLRAALGRLWRPNQITLRSGEPLRSDHLERVDFARASTIVLMADERSDLGVRDADIQTIKTLLSIGKHPLLARPGVAKPHLVVEVVNPRRADLAEEAYDGQLSVLCCDEVVSRLMAQNIRHPGLSSVYTEILSHGYRTELFTREQPGLVGLRFEELLGRFPRAVVLGWLRLVDGRDVPMLNPPPDSVVAPGDRLVLLAHDWASCRPEASGAASEGAIARGVPNMAGSTGSTARRILILGWSHVVPFLLQEIASYTTRPERIVTVSLTSAAERAQSTPAALVERTEHIEADYADPGDWRRIPAETADAIVLVGTGRVTSDEEADARTAVAFLQLRRRLQGATREAALLVELMQEDNASLLTGCEHEVLISPQLFAHMLAQVALRPDLHPVFEELFTAGGAEITYRPPQHYGVELGAPVSFRAIAEAVLARGHVALGVAWADRDAELNPPRDAPVRLNAGDQLVVLVTYDDVAGR